MCFDLKQVYVELRYYGIKNKIRKENILYTCVKARAKFKSLLPGKFGESYKSSFDFLFKERYTFDKNVNSIPKGRFLRLDQIVTSDLIYREDIELLQKGIRALLKKYRAGHRFIGLPTKSLEEVCASIDKMDSMLPSWYNTVRCGVFDFQNEKQALVIDYFTLNIKNINSSYLSLEFQIFLTEKKRAELDQLIAADYHTDHGYVTKTLASRKDGGAKNAYSVAYYGDDMLKSDRIYEWISCIEWEFYNSLERFFPLILHKQNIMPPRIEIYYTDIDYHSDNVFFWLSVGIVAENGQFIDERQKLFFKTCKSSRYEDADTNSRLVYIIKEDGIKVDRWESVRSKVNYHIDEYAKEYFRFLFLRILECATSQKIIRYKKQLDKIKLNKDKLNVLIKLRYEFEREIDLYVRYARDDFYGFGFKNLQLDFYRNSNELVQKSRRYYGITCKSFAKSVVSEAKKLDSAIKILQADFTDKENILQHLADYRRNSRNWLLNVATFLVAAVSLFFIIFPAKQVAFAVFLASIWKWLVGIVNNAANFP